jgi:hypothetical protein
MNNRSNECQAGVSAPVVHRESFMAYAKHAQIVQRSNGWQYQARSQYPMDRDGQRKAGLLAIVNTSIHGRTMANQK